MLTRSCIGVLCFVPIERDAAKIFGFPEFLTALALIVLAWTTADERYRFRIQTAPIPLRPLAFASVVTVGMLTLATDLWRAQGWLVPEGRILTPASWQALLGLELLSVFLLWVWFAFIQPAPYSPRNALRFARALYRIILNGTTTELTIVGQELARSADAIIQFAPRKSHGRPSRPDRPSRKRDQAVDLANDILLLLGDPRLCRALVASTPGTIVAFFGALSARKKYDVAIATFARNIVGEAIANRDSFLYHEAEGFYSGLMGYHKPVSQAMFSNWRMVEEVRFLLEPDYRQRTRWEADQWEAYCRIVGIVIGDYLQQTRLEHSSVLALALDHMKGAVGDVYKMNDSASLDWHGDILRRLQVVVDFLQDTMKALDERGLPDHYAKRSRGRIGFAGTLLDQLAEAIVEVVFVAAAVRAPVDTSWWVQHNTVWAPIFEMRDGPVTRIIQFKVRRLIYDEIKRLREFPNYKGGKFLGFCLNVLGLNERKGSIFTANWPLQKAVLSWTRRNLDWLYAQQPAVVDSCLVEDMKYEPEQLRVVKTYRVQGLRRKPEFDYLQVQPSRQRTIGSK